MRFSHCWPGSTVTVHDGCIKAIRYCNGCSSQVTQPKRRPAGSVPDKCTWRIPCDDHPKNLKC